MICAASVRSTDHISSCEARFVSAFIIIVLVIGLICSNNDYGLISITNSTLFINVLMCEAVTLYWHCSGFCEYKFMSLYSIKLELFELLIRVL